MIKFLIAFLLGCTAFAFSDNSPYTTTDYKSLKAGKFYRIVNHEKVTIYCDHNRQFITIKPNAKSTWFRVNNKFIYSCKM